MSQYESAAFPHLLDELKTRILEELNCISSGKEER